MEYTHTIKDFIIDNFLFGEKQEITADTNLLEKGIIDSTGVVELVSFLEDTYNIIVEDEEIISDNFSTLRSISNFLEIKINRNSKL
jgi:acyl carrier protein